MNYDSVGKEIARDLHPTCKLYSNKYMIVSTQITNTEISALMSVLDFKLLTCKVLFTNRTDNRDRYKVGYFLRK